MDAEQIAYRPAQLAKLLGVSRPTLYRLLNTPGFPVVRLGGCTLIPADSLKIWLNSQMEGCHEK